LKALRIASYIFLGLVAVLLLTIGLVYLRLQSGPVALGFLSGRIETAINANLTGMHVSMGGAVLEIDPTTRVPSVHFQNLAMRDDQGNIIASAPRAAVSLDTSSMFIGRIVPRSLSLIGPRISVRRKLDGSVALGVGGEAAPADAEVVVDENFGRGIDTPGKSAPDPAALTNGAKLISILDSHDGNGALSTLEDIRITRAAVSFYDDANSVSWVAPRADLTFKKTDFGFVVLAKADVASAGEPWHAEISTTYYHDTQGFDISAKVDNFVPANVADKIYGLSQFAKLTTPLSGHVEIQQSSDGKLTAASAEMTMSSGAINLPDYFAEPVAIDNGTLEVKFKPETGNFSLDNSTLTLAGNKTNVDGELVPIRSDDGRLTAIGINLKAAAATKGGDVLNGHVDRIEFSGQALIDQARVNIDDLVVMSGSTGVRMRGNISGGDESPAIHLAGRIRDISAALLKSIWPPIVGTKTRAWVTENVVDGRVTEGTFEINLDENALAEGKKNHRLPDNSLDLQFKMENVSTHVFKALPLLENASGEGRLKDNDFDLTLSSGQSRLPSGETLKLNNGSFQALSIALEEVPGNFTFDIEGTAQSMLNFAALPDLKMLNAEALSSLAKVKGNARALVAFSMPLIKDVPKDRVQFTTKIKLTDIQIPDVMTGIDITGGDLDVDLGEDLITISGPAKFNGLNAKLTWVKPRGEGSATAEVFATLDAATREKMGLKIKDYVSGDIPIHAILTKDAKGNSVAEVEADLATTSMKLTALGWKRPATPGTKSSFVFRSTDQGRMIDNFRLDGDGLHLRGTVQLSNAGKLLSVNMDQIKLDDDNILQAKLVPGDGSFDLQITGNKLDARPSIKTLVDPNPPTSGTGSANEGGIDFTMRAHFDQVIANRGENVNDVDATIRVRAGKIADANVKGNLLSGQPVTITVVPNAEGRELRVLSSDAGSILRAANFYSKVAGGQLSFFAMVGNEEGSPVRVGRLEIKDFEVRNEAALAELDKRGRPTKSGPRKDGLKFQRFWLPFKTDDKFIRLGDSLLRGPDLCATADGVIRKVDGALDITGSVVPACGVSGIFNNIPLLGDLLSGGNSNEGLFGVTYAVGGTLAAPKVQVNPLSALAPGIFRRFFDFNARKSPGQNSGAQSGNSQSPTQN
jgi:hypothetical protein